MPEADAAPDTLVVESHKDRGLVFRNKRFIISSRRNKRIYYKCHRFRDACKARLVIDLQDGIILPTNMVHSH